MSEWWLQTEQEIQSDPIARHNRQVAVHRVLYSTEEGRLVLNMIRELCYESGNVEMIALYDTIRNIAGRTRLTELVMIEAEAKAIVFDPEDEIVEPKEGEE